MGSSNRKKKEKKKDFQKPKLKVGKAKAKPANFTDTSFASKSIVVNQSALAGDSSDAIEHFKSQLSLAVSSKTDSQRKESLSYLTNQLSAQPPNNPVGTLGILTKVLPLITDSSTPVRSQLLKLLRALPPSEVCPHVERTLMYIRGGMTHLSDEIRNDTLSVMEWLLDVAGAETVACPGGWMKTLNSFSSMLGWNPIVGSSISNKGWTSTSSSSKTAGFVATKRGGPQAQARQMQVLARFLQEGFKPEKPVPYNPRAYWDNLYRLPGASNPFAYLNLFGTPRDEDADMYPDRHTRITVYTTKWSEPIARGMENAKKEGGAVGRAAAVLDQVLKEASGTKNN